MPSRLPPRARIGLSRRPAADPKLAALIARSGLGTDAASASRPPNRARSSRAGDRGGSRALKPGIVHAARRCVDAGAAPVGLAPIAYNLGVTVGWKRFARAGRRRQDRSRHLPGSRDALDVGVSYTGKPSHRPVKAVTDRPLADTRR